MAAINPRPNPYVGPRAFTTGESLYGRDREIHSLLDQLIAERILLLYSPSGAGKTSLISAGLIPSLSEAGFHVLPIVRVNQEPPTPLQTSLGEHTQPNRYIFSTLLSLEEGLPPEQQTPLDALANLSLSEYLAQHPVPASFQDANGAPAEVLIFDQFEEVITLDPIDQEGKEAFFTQLGAALRNRNRWALFSIREDYVGALDPYLRPIPTRLTNRFRLDLLTINAARQAIQLPVKLAGVEFSQKAVGKLLNDLRQIQVQRPDGSMEIRPGLYVEPVQLQVVCFHLWQHLAADKNEISEEDLSAIGSVDQSLAEYYAEQVTATAEKVGVKERHIRAWFEHELITENGIRSQVLMGSQDSEGLSNQAIRLLENAHLVRAEKRLGATWFELAHDRLIQPIRLNNAEWFQANLSLLQRQAGLWARQNRSETLYLRDEALQHSETWAADHPDELSEIDRQFLTACLEARAREQEARLAEERERQLKLEAAQQLAEAERRRAEEQAHAAAKLRRRAYILAAVLLLAVGLAALAGLSQMAAQNNARRAVEQRGTAQAASTLAFQNAATAQAASTLAYENALQARDNAAAAQAASTAAIAQQATAEYNAQVAKEQEQIARQQARLARSRELASLALSFLKQNTALTLLLSKEAMDMADTGQALDALLRGLQRNLSRTAEKYGQTIPAQEISINALAASPDGKLLAWGGPDGLIRVWDLETQKPVWDHIVTPDKTVFALAFSPDGKTLASGDAAGVLAFWDVRSGQRVRRVPVDLLTIYALAFSPDGSRVAYAGQSTGTEANLLARNLQDGTIKSFRIRQGEVSETLSLAWSPDGKLLASGGRDRIVHIWDVSTALEIATLKNIIEENSLVPVYDGPIHGLAFSPNGKWLATGAEDNEGSQKNKTVLIWDTATWNRDKPIVLPGVNANLSSLAFSPDGQILAGGYANGETVLWNFNNQQIIETINEHQGPVTGLGFSSFEDTLLLVTGGLDRLVKLNNLIAQQSLSTSTSKGKGNSTVLAIRPDGKLIVAGNTPPGLMTWTMSLSDQMELKSDPGIQSSVNSVMALNQDGDRLAIATQPGQLAIHALNKTEVISITLPGVETSLLNSQGGTSTLSEPASVDSLAFSPDGEILAAGLCTRMQETVDPESNQPIRSCLQNVIYLWKATDGERLTQIPTNQTSSILSLAFNPGDPNQLAVGYQNASIQFWNLAEGKESGLPLVGSGGPVTSLAFHLDGDILASGSDNNLIALWNLNPPQLIGDPLAGPDGRVTSLVFSRDATLFYSASNKGTVLRWNISDWMGIACDLAQRNLTQTEWEQFFSAEPFRPTCERIPSPTSTPTPAPDSASTPPGASQTPSAAP